MSLILPSIGSGIIASPTAPPYSNTYSALLDGTDDAVETTYSPTVGSTAFTATMWIKSSNTTTNQGFISNNSSSSVHNLAVLSPTSTHSFFVIINNGSTQSLINGIGGNNSTLDIRDGNWHHLAITVNGTSVKIYKDGGDAAINSSNPTNTQGTPFGTWTSGTSYIGKAQNFWFGTNGSLSYSSGNRYYLDGNIDEAAVWESELSGSDISAIYNSGLPNDISSYSPVGYWRMGDNDSGTGTTITDQGSGGNDATLDNGAAFSTDVPTAPAAYSTNSIDLDGINDYVSITPSSSIDLYGLSFWINCDFTIDKNTLRGVLLAPGGTNWFLGLGGNFTGSLTDELISINTGARYGYGSSTDTISTGWHNIIAAWSTSSATTGGNGYDIYLDGVKVGNQSNTTYGAATLFSIPTSEIRFGERFGSLPYPGFMDEVAIFDSTLSSSDISTIYNSGTPSNISSLSPAGWWRMGENDGASGTTITDQGSGSNDGTLVNGPTFSTNVP